MKWACTLVDDTGTLISIINGDKQNLLRISLSVCIYSETWKQTTTATGEQLFHHNYGEKKETRISLPPSEYYTDRQECISGGSNWIRQCNLAIWVSSGVGRLSVLCVYFSLLSVTIMILEKLLNCCCDCVSISRYQINTHTH